MVNKEMYTREEVMRWTLDFVWERIAELRREEGTCKLSVIDCEAIVMEFNVDGMLTRTRARKLQSLLEDYHEKWIEFYMAHYKGLSLMNRTHDSLSYYYEAYYYFCRPGTYKV